MTEYICRRKKISHLEEKTPISCGYSTNLYVYESLQNCELVLKEKLKADEITFLNGSKLSQERFGSIFFFNVPDHNKEIPKFPTHFKKNFFKKLDNFLEDFKAELKKQLIKSFTNNEDINLLKPHSDKIDILKKCFFSSYSIILEKYPEFEKSKKVNEFKFFKNTFGIIDKMVRFIKSFIFSKEYKKDLYNEDDEKNTKNFINILITKLFQNINGNEWFLYNECDIPEPFKIEEKDIYDKDIITTKPYRKDFIFKNEQGYETVTILQEEKKINILRFLKVEKKIWDTFQNFKNNLKKGNTIIILYFKDLKLTTFIQTKKIKKSSLRINPPSIYYKIPLMNGYIQYYKEDKKIIINQNRIIQNVKLEIFDNCFIFYKL